MADDFATNPWRLEDIHRLDDAGLRDSQARSERRQFGGAGERVEDRVEIVQRVADLVEAVFPGLPEPSALVEGVVLEEETDLVPGFVEIAVLELRLQGRREHVPDRLRVESGDEFEGARLQPPA